MDSGPFVFVDLDVKTGKPLFLVPLADVWEMLKLNRPQVWRSEAHDMHSPFGSHRRVNQ